MVKKWSIYWVNLDPVTGSEQAGKRPCLVISNNVINDVLPVITILPITSAKKDARIYPTEIYLDKNISGLLKDSIVMVHQIRTISKNRVLKRCGELTSPKVLDNINNVLIDYFEL